MSTVSPPLNFLTIGKFAEGARPSRASESGCMHVGKISGTYCFTVNHNFDTKSCLDMTISKLENNLNAENIHGSKYHTKN